MTVLPYKTFLLDDYTTQSTNYIQVLTINDTTRFTMFNPAKPNIHIYDIVSGMLLNSIYLYTDGPNNVGRNIQGYYLSSLDSVYLYDYWLHSFIVVNREGKIIDRINLTDKLQPTNDCVIPPSLYPRSDAPIRKVQDKIIMQGMDGQQGGCTELKCMASIIYNLTSGSIKFANPFPKIYGTHNQIVSSWGSFSYRLVFYDLNNRNEMIVSFPADDHIYVYDIESDHTKSFFAGHSNKDHINPLTNNTMSSEYRHYLEQTQYVGVFYDKYRDLYYRLVVHPLYDYDINDRSTFAKKISIIILDSHFNKVGEYDLAEQTRHCANTFVSEEGLHINIESEDDDFLKFISLKPVKL